MAFNPRYRRMRQKAGREGQREVVGVVVMVIVMVSKTKTKVSNGKKSDLSKDTTDRHPPPKSMTKHSAIGNN